jgi:hypothetical protein
MTPQSRRGKRVWEHQYGMLADRPRFVVTQAQGTTVAPCRAESVLQLLWVLMSRLSPSNDFHCDAFS